MFGRLEGMVQNSLYANLLLTGLVSRLASYPNPLLRSFLLNVNLVFQPSVKSLVQVCAGRKWGGGGGGYGGGSVYVGGGGCHTAVTLDSTGCNTFFSIPDGYSIS